MLGSPACFTGVCERGDHSYASSIEGETTGRRDGTHGTCATPMRSRQHLLPGIPDDITLNEIVPKLSWRAVFILSCVSTSWQEAIRANLVYEARVRANVTETLLVHHHIPSGYSDRGALALYSLSERRCYELPPIPHLPSGTPTTLTCVVLDGKLYALGGHILDGKLYALGGHSVVDGSCSSKEVFVLDLARQRKWKRCASMLKKRSCCGCSVMDGKIYAFGALSFSNPSWVIKFVVGCEVYDTQENSWSPIMPLPGKRTSNEDVARVGKELFVYSVRSRNLSAYDPAKNHWRLIENFWGGRSVPFIRQENFYSLSVSGIDKYDVETSSWVSLHTNSFPTVKRNGSMQLNPVRVWAGHDELLFLTAQVCEGYHSFQCNLGLDSEKKELVWQETNCSSRKFLDVQCSIQL